MVLDTVLAGAYVCAPSTGWKAVHADVGIAEGRIAAVGDLSCAEAEDVRDASGCILMPGLINTHCHGDMTLARGFGDGLTLAGQNEAFADTGWFYSLITDEERLASRKLTYLEALRSGTTYLCENMYWTLGDASAQAMAALGLMGVLAEDVRRDYTRPDEFFSDEELLALKAEAEAAGLDMVLGSISEEDYEPSRLRAIEEIRKRTGLGKTCHLAETDWRMERIAREYHTTPIRMLAGCGALDAGTVGSHVVHADEEDIRLLAAHGVSVANTPACEMKIADGAAPITAMVRAGVNVCLGTDGAMWDNTNDMFGAMKAMALLQSLTSGVDALKPEEILSMATVNGAKAFGREKDMGDIREGMLANLITVRVSGKPKFIPFVPGEGGNAASLLVFNARGEDVEDVYVRGQQVVKNGRHAYADLEKIAETVQRAAERIAAHEQTKRAAR